MTEYWVSQGRHFCTYCKCWTADNKASIQFHEKGKRHLESVKQKIDELKKKGTADYMAKSETERAIAKMEKDALEAFKNDLKANPDLAIQYGFKPYEGEPSQQKQPKAELQRKQEHVVEWYEAKSPDDHSYYWNIVTKVTTWEKPNDFKTLEQQKLEKKSKKKNNDNSDIQELKSTSEDNTTDSKETQSNTKIMKTEKAKFIMHPKKKRAQLHARFVDTSTESNKSTTRSTPVPTGLSQWTTVEPVVNEQPPDLDLPISNKTNVTTTKVTTPAISEKLLEKPTFTERTVTSLGKSERVVFKKRKLTASKNTRVTNYDNVV